MDNRIKIENLSKRYGDYYAVKNVNCCLQDGKIYGLVGRNGSGKTVLMKMICGFSLPTEGNVWVSGKQIGKDVDFAPGTGMLIERPSFLKYYSGRRNLMNLAGINKKIGKEEIDSIMERVHLNPEDHKVVGKYSLGMKQRLGIAQAIMENPDVLILDEPMNGLDEDGVQLVRDLLLDLKAQGKCILLSSHNREDIEVLCDEVYTMVNGEMIKRIHNRQQCYT